MKLTPLFLWHGHAPGSIAVRGSPVQTFFMGKLVAILVAVALAFGLFYLTMKKAPVTDKGTAPTQAISLTGVRKDLLSIAQAERSNIALNSHCSSVDELISSGSLTMTRPERDGYTYEVQCASGDSAEFKVVARHAPAPAGSPIRYPILGTDQDMQISEVE
ncbi:MAG TPA: hypothetical protein VKT53_05675 [Candidatus Acidoferrum sp.]|nr:hypothetical protein [Candidatus Acidoferrum sp.]